MHSTKHFPSIKRLFYHMLFLLGTVAYPKKWTTQPRVFPAGGGGGGSPPYQPNTCSLPPPPHPPGKIPPPQSALPHQIFIPPLNNNLQVITQ